MAKEEVLAQKQVIIDEVVEKLQNSQSVVVAEYRGLTVAEVTELRRELRAENVDLKVYKNKLVKRATEVAQKTELNDYLVGPNALAFGEQDAVAPARVLAKFAKKHANLVIKTAIVEGKLLTTDEVKEIAKLPDRKGMYSMFLGTLKAPVSKFARAIQAVADAKANGAEAPQSEASEETAA